jgi:hypothetical protein
MSYCSSKLEASSTILDMKRVNKITQKNNESKISKKDWFSTTHKIKKTNPCVVQQQ